MGLLKKVFKPVAKVLDKIVPNEIKPFLPYAAAFAPVFGPTAGIFGNTMMKRALLSGGANILGQLSQEGSEGDINLLSAGLGALTGAMTTPGAAGDFKAMQSANKLQDANVTRTALQKATDFGLEGLAKGSELLRPGGDIPNLFSKEGLKAATIPASTATGDVMAAEARRSAKEVADAALLGLDEGASDADRALAIRSAMEAYGYFSDDEIEETITAAGYKAGGRVGFDRGGLGALGRMMAPKEESKYITKKSDTSETDTINRIYEEQGSDGLSAYLDRNPDLKDKYVIVADGMSGELTIMPNKLHPDFMDTENIIMLKSGDGGNIIDMSGMFENKAKGGRVGFRFGGIDAAIDKVEDESIKESVKMIADMPDMDLMDLIEEFEITFKRKPMNMEELKQFYRENYEMESPVRMKEKIKEKVTVEAKDGGLMNLGGKEMDLRGGGFVPIGKKERADDVPARLSKNEFVMTADAVRAAGGGSVNKGAKRMYELMNNLEARV